MRPLFVGLGVIGVSALVWLSATAKEEAGETSGRVGDVERVLACEELRSTECRTLAVRAVAACTKFPPCRRALLAGNVKEVNQRIQQALDALKGGDAGGQPKQQGGGLPGPRGGPKEP